MFSKSQKDTAVGDRTEQVDGYKRTLANGTVVTVQDHSRTNDAATAAVIAQPGRPPLAAKPGTFPMGRFIPNLWLKPLETTALPEEPPEAQTVGANPLDSDKKKKDSTDKKAAKVVNALADLVKEKSEKKAPGGKK